MFSLTKQKKSFRLRSKYKRSSFKANVSKYNRRSLKTSSKQKRRSFKTNRSKQKRRSFKTNRSKQKRRSFKKSLIHKRGGTQQEILLYLLFLFLKFITICMLNNFVSFVLQEHDDSATHERVPQDNDKSIISVLGTHDVELKKKILQELFEFKITERHILCHMRSLMITIKISCIYTV